MGGPSWPLAELPPSLLLGCCCHGNSLSHPERVFLLRRLDEARFAQLNRWSQGHILLITEPSRSRRPPCGGQVSPASPAAVSSSSARGGAHPLGDLRVVWKCSSSGQRGSGRSQGSASALPPPCAAWACPGGRGWRGPSCRGAALTSSQGLGCVSCLVSCSVCRVIC